MTTRAQIAALVDHTLLKPEATTAQVDALIAEAAALGAYSVCVSPSLLPLELPDGLHLATVCGFPSGAHATAVKATEAADAVAKGAEEIDMVVNLRLVKEGDVDGVEADIPAGMRSSRSSSSPQPSPMMRSSPPVVPPRLRAPTSSRPPPDFTPPVGPPPTPSPSCVPPSETVSASRPPAASALPPTLWPWLRPVPTVWGCPLPPLSWRGWTTEQSESG